MGRQAALESSSSSVGKTMAESERQDQLLLLSAIVNGEDLGPFVRKAFESGRLETLLGSLRLIARSKEAEIEEMCRAHYQDFISAVDDLRSLLSAVDSLKSSLSETDATLQSVASPLLTTLDGFLEARATARNLSAALAASRLCVHLFELLHRANSHIIAGNFYLALRAIDAVEQDLLSDAPHPTIRRMLTRFIPTVRADVERKVTKDFNDWMVQIRVASRHLGQVAISRASAARQREEDLRIKQTQAEEQTRVAGSAGHGVYSFEEDDDADDIAVAAVAIEGAAAGFDLTPLYRAFHIHQTLCLEDRFRRYYLENRKLQLTSDFQVSSTTPFLESHQTFFAQTAGFFIFEDRILRTGGGLIARSDVDDLWETALAKMISVLEDQFVRMQTASHLLLVKDYVSLFAVTLRRYGYTVDPLLHVLAKHRDKYHDLLLSECRQQVSEVVTPDRFEQMVVTKEYEYSMNVLSFQLQITDIMPAFPYVAPFSSTIPELCRIARSCIEDSVNFMSYCGQLNFYPIIKKYLERLLGEVFDGAFFELINSTSLGVSQAMQVAADLTVMERACDYFFRHAAQLSGIPMRVAHKGPQEFPLKRSQVATEELLLGLLVKKIDDFMLLTESISWMADSPPINGNEYSSEVILYLETLVSTAQQILPIQILHRVLNSILSHISEKIVGLFLNDALRRFNSNAVMGFDADVKLFELFADDQANLFTETDERSSNELRLALAGAKQLINLLMSNNPENFLNPVIREKNYNKLDYKKVVAVLEKFRDSSDRMFSAFGTRGAKQTPKEKALETLIKRLKDAA